LYNFVHLTRAIQKAIGFSTNIFFAKGIRHFID
jgi:hypothetical protein